jgi:glycosyltransferase involved in cell wall biosynthesis
MRILHVSTRLILGGSQENTVLSCEGQARLGHEVHLAFGPIHGPEGSLLARVEAFGERCRAGAERTPVGGTCEPIRTHVVPHMAREISPIADLRCRRELAGLIADLRPDIVHTHSSKAGILGRSAAWSVNRMVGANSRVGIVHTVHGPPFMPVEGSRGRRLRVRVTNLVYQIAERYAAGRCHVIVSVADAMTAQFMARGIGWSGQYVTIRSGMETERFLHAAPGESREEARLMLGLGASDFVVGTVARLAQHKGHDDLLDALGDDLKAHATWRLLWVGDGWWRERLVARARGMGLGVRELDRPDGSRDGAASRVILTGLVEPDRVAAHVRAMDVLAHPSYREGMPRTIPQALLCGVCPVAYDVDGTREVCRDGVTGLLVAPGDRAGLRDAVRRLEGYPEERRAMADRGREECRVRFAAETMVAELERVYTRALESARRS